MTPADILSHVDHTLLKPEATAADIEALCSESLRCSFASVCVNPRFVSHCAGLLGGRIPVCTVIGFPLGASAAAVKVFETKEAISSGADEVDLVIPIGALRSGALDEVSRELFAVREASAGKVLKVIVETCLLNGEQKRTVCRQVAESGADYIKNSTGFSTGGATAEDISLFAREIACRRYPLKIKASGGIRTRADMERFLALGADRLGCSAAVSLLGPLLDR